MGRHLSEKGMSRYVQLKWFSVMIAIDQVAMTLPSIHQFTIKLYKFPSLATNLAISSSPFYRKIAPVTHFRQTEKPTVMFDCAPSSRYS